MNAACVRIAMMIGAMLYANAASAQTWDVLTPQLNAIEFGRQNAQTINDGSDSGPDFAPDDLGANLMASLASPTSQGAAQAARSIETGFRYSPDRTKQNLRNFVARTPGGAARAQLEQALAAQPRLMEDIAAGVRTYGFDPHNVADAYAVWWINAWGTSEKRNIEPDAATVAAVKQQVYAAFAATPGFAATSDAERQEFAEEAEGAQGGSILMRIACVLGEILDGKLNDWYAKTTEMGNIGKLDNSNTSQYGNLSGEVQALRQEFGFLS